MRIDLTLPTNFIPLYEGLLRSVSGKLRHDLEYCALAPRCGGDYAGKLMFYGRATNGWIKESSFMPDDLKNPTRLAHLAERIVANAQKPICTPEGEEGLSGPYVMRKDHTCDRDPMHWVRHDREYVTERRSQYMRCAKEITALHLGVSAESWYRHVAWSNLYKIGPQQREGSNQAAGNPSGGLQKAQRAECAHILMDEVRHFRPSCIVFLTEVNEATGYFYDFSEWLTTKVKRNLGLKYVSATGRLQSFGHECNIVLAQHPQGRPSSSVAKDVLNAMSSF